MGIYLANMEMPKSCYVCPFCDYVSARCDAVNGNPYTPESRYEKRADFCPLIPVPDHGRLIDADAFEKENSFFWNRDFINSKYSDTLADLVNSAPTIIPASGGNENE